MKAEANPKITRNKTSEYMNLVIFLLRWVVLIIECINRTRAITTSARPMTPVTIMNLSISGHYIMCGVEVNSGSVL